VNSKFKMIAGLSLSMFFSPCLEIEAYFLAAGAQSIWWTVVLSAIYFSITIVGMIAWVSIAYEGANKLNWHRLEHNAGIITGVILIITGVISFITNY
jgi:nickel/cobalt transporter (NicO) family protein